MGQHVLLVPFSWIRQREVDLQKQQRIAEGRTKVAHVTLHADTIQTKAIKNEWGGYRDCIKTTRDKTRMYSTCYYVPGA